MSTNDKLREARTAAEEFAKGNASECAAEIINWQDTAILKDGKVRDLAVLCAKYVGGDHALRAAESLIHRACMERAALAASKPEPQARAGEPEVVAHMYLAEYSSGSYSPPYKEWRVTMNPLTAKYEKVEPLITLQSHREAMAKEIEERENVRRANIEAKQMWDMLYDDYKALKEAIAKKDAALKVCVDTLNWIDQNIDLSKYASSPPNNTLLDDTKAAITQAQEALE